MWVLGYELLADMVGAPSLSLQHLLFLPCTCRQLPTGASVALPDCCLWLLGPFLGQVQCAGGLAPESSRQPGWVGLEVNIPASTPYAWANSEVPSTASPEVSKGEPWLPIVAICCLTRPLLGSFPFPLHTGASWHYLPS